MKIECFLIPDTKMNSKWFKDLNIRHDTIKLLEENIDINHSSMGGDLALKTKEIKQKINKCNIN